VATKAGMSELKKRLVLLEQVATGHMPLDESRRRRTGILHRSRRGRLLLRIERAEQSRVRQNFAHGRAKLRLTWP
jgi:hypothetical protein